MRKIFTFILSTLMVTTLMAQRPEAVIQKAGEVKPVIDGVMDELWETVEKHNVDKPFGTEAPTLGEAGTSYWKALYDEAGMYIIIVANDDVWHPYSGTGDAYTFDKIEMYFDTNYILNDGVGGQGGTSGNRQIAPDPDLTALDGTMKTQTILGGDVNYAYKLDGTAWTTEWFVPWESIPDGTGAIFDRAGTMGFDVDITDNDNDGVGRKRAMWANVGTVSENWNNMDDAGYLTFEGAESILMTDIVLSGAADITTDNGTVQLVAAVEPENTTQGYKLKIIEGSDLVTLSKGGLITAIKNGVVKVRAYSSDDFVESNEIIINISGQLITIDEISLIKNGNFDKGLDGKESWGGAGTIEDGWLTIVATPSTNMWDIMSYQGVKVADAATQYFIKFKAKSSVDMVVPFIMEDTSHDYNKALTSTSPYRATDYWNIPVTTTAKWFEFDVTHTAFVEGSTYQPSFQVGLLDGTLYVDSIAMYTEADLALLSTSIKKELSSNNMSVYPNPVGSGNELIVSLAATNTKIAIYNSLGQKLMEKAANGTMVRFNVSSLAKGMYFVRLSDGTSQKFIR